MKAVLLALAVALAGAPRLPQTPPAGLSATGSIEVVVKRSGGAPLDDVDVTLTGPGPMANPSMITTGKDGRALFRNIPFGSYQVRAERVGYLWVRSDGGSAKAAAASVELGTSTPGVANEQLRILLRSAGIISGKVVDAKGRPLRGVSIIPARATFDNGRRTLVRVNTVDMFRTDDLGEFRVFGLPPGEYYLLAERELRDPNYVNQNIYQPAVYYPGTTDLSAAAVVRVREGQETQADIVLRTVEGRTISGVVVSSVPISSNKFSMYLNPVTPGFVSDLHSNVVIPALESTDTASQFHFEIRGVPPGTYDLLTDNFSAPRVSSKNRIEVGNTDPDGVTIALHNGTEVRGHFSASSDTRLFPNPETPPWAGGIARFGASFKSIDRLTDRDDISVRTGEGETDLSFLASADIESRYRIYFASLPQGVFLTDVRQDGHSIFNDGVVDAGPGTVNLELILGTNGGAVSGSVTIPATDDAPAVVAVVLIPDKLRQENSILYRRQELMVMKPGTPVPFSFNGISPGSYRVMACDYLLRGDEMNPNFLTQYEQRGTAVNLVAGQSITSISLPLIRTGE